MKRGITVKGLKMPLLLLYIVFSFFNTIHAQSAKSLIKKGKKEFRDDNIEAAVEYFEQALSIDESNYYAAYLVGISYLGMSSPEKALNRFSLMEPEEFKLKDIYYWLALVNFQNHHFDKANHYIEQHRIKFKKFMQADINELEKKNRLAKIFYAMESSYKIENLGENINSEFAEYSAVLTADHRTIHFTTKRKENKGAERLGVYMEDILSSTMDEDDHWAKAERLKEVVTLGHDATIQLFEDDTKMIIYKKEDLFIVERKNGKWGNLKSIGKEINRNDSREAHGFISTNGNTLIFSSDYKSTNKDLNLFISHKLDNDAWSKPMLLSELNTNYDEDSPFIDEDGTLYFSSKGHNSMGGFDIFRSNFNPVTKKYSAPVNMGYPINSVSDDIFFNVKNKVAYFTSSRVGGFGREDIYRAYLFNEIDIELSLIDKTNDLPFSNAKIYIKSDDKNYEFVTNKEGKVHGTIPAFQDFNIKLVKDRDTLYTHTISPVTSLKNPTKFESTIEFYRPENIGGVMALKENRTEEELEDKLDQRDIALNVKNTTIAQKEKVKLEKNVIETIKESSFERIYFDFDRATLKPESLEALNAFLTYLKQNKTIRAEIGGHTDSFGSAVYNQSLSLKRANAVVDYLVKNGIAKDRLLAKGYGETQPIASNDKEVNGREKNRRIEFKILKQPNHQLSKNE